MDAERGAFVRSFGDTALDAANLRIPLVGFLPFDDPRVLATVRKTEQELAEGPFVWRYLRRTTASAARRGRSSPVRILARRVPCAGGDTSAAPLRASFEALLGGREPAGAVRRGVGTSPSH